MAKTKTLYKTPAPRTSVYVGLVLASIERTVLALRSGPLRQQAELLRSSLLAHVPFRS